MKVAVNVEYQRAKKENFQKQMIKIARDDAIIQRSNIMSNLCEWKTIAESVLNSNNRKELLFEKSMVLFCSVEKLQIHNSENQQQKMWIITLKTILDLERNREKVSELRSEVDFELGVSAEIDGSSLVFCRTKVVG